MPELTVPGSELKPSDLTTFTIKIDGQDLPGTYSIVGIDITREVNRIPNAAVVLYDGDASKQDFELSSGEHLLPGKTLEILGGYGSSQDRLFKGIITGQRIRVKRGGDSFLQIWARDSAFRMMLDRKSYYFKDLTDSELFEELIGRYPDLTAEVQATNVKFPEVVQYQVSDWDLIITRAEKIGKYCLCDDGTFHINNPDLQGEPVSKLVYGLNVFDVDLDMDARSQFKKVTASAWSHEDQEIIRSDVEDVSSPPQGNVDGKQLAEVGAVDNFEARHSGALQQQEVDAWAEAGMIKSRFSKIRGTIRVQGSHALKPGVLVELGGMGDRFNGKAFVSGIRHTLGEGDWETIVQIGLQPRWHHETFDVNGPPASGFHPAINGLHTGIVTQLQDDPEGEDRILVKVPLISADDDGVWSRIATLDAGKDRGTVFRPEIGDEVIVGFINDDPNEPVVLGMLHSSNKPAPISASDENHEKGLVTRSGMKIQFNDDKRSTTIETPNGNKIIISDDDGQILLKDETGNSITMNSSGIALDSPKNIVLTAKGEVKVEATTSATMTGKGGATVKSDANTVVKGTMVQIN